MRTRTRWLLAFFLTALAGTALHFLYDLLPNPLTALIAPVNESVWEHLKLSFWPFLAAAAALTRKSKTPQADWSGFLAGLLLIPLALLGCYYTLLCGFGISGLATDIGLYYLTLGLGFWTAAHWQNPARTGLLIVLAAFYAMCLMLFTISPPPFPIFISPT